MTFIVNFPTPHGQQVINFKIGSTTIFLGANGSGKTRLAVHIDENSAPSHRISAHRALNLNPDVPKITQAKALNFLRLGGESEQYSKVYHRFQGKAAVFLINDFDHVIQYLFAEQNKTTLISHKKAKSGNSNDITDTKFEKLQDIWDQVIVHRQLLISGDTIEACVTGTEIKYLASEMSDGERAVFYLTAQVLSAAENSLIIFDEPEIHIHRAIMDKLSDALEASRPDCAFIIITHDLEFASSRVGQKIIVRDYTPEHGWTIEPVPSDTGFSEEITTLILGSRKPILFVEGTLTSLDMLVYRACYPEWTVIPRSSCEQVIHSVVTMRANASLTRVTCSGIVDADDYDSVDAANLARLGIRILPVSEIENLILLPAVSRAIAEHEGYTGTDLTVRLAALKAAAFAKINQPGALDRVVTRYCRRRIDRALKKIDLSAADTVTAIAAEYSQKTSTLDIAAIGAAAEAAIQQAVQEDNLPAFLRAYDDKGFLSLAASHLKSTSQNSFVDWLSRVLRNDSVPALTTAIRGHLPPVYPH